MSKKSRKNLVKQIRVGIVGVSGRMGAEILALAGQDSVFKPVAIPRNWSIKPEEIDVVIEFSSPEGLSSTLKWCVKNRKALVSGTTGIGGTASERQLKSAALKIPVLYSANMSLGIAVLSSMLERFQVLKDWDFQINEVHHNQKKDRPSGTALLLQKKLESTLGTRLPPAQSLRGGGVPGIHQVWAMGPEEVLTLEHTAFNRKVFARGALRAALWLFDKQDPGLYDLSDLYKV